MANTYHYKDPNPHTFPSTEYNDYRYIHLNIYPRSIDISFILNLKHEIADLLVGLKTAMRISRRKLSDLTGISTYQLRQIERAERYPTLMQLIVLGIAISDDPYALLPDERTVNGWLVDMTDEHARQIQQWRKHDDLPF